MDFALADGHVVYVPSICIVELTYLVEKGKIPEAVADRVGQVLGQAEFGFRLAVLDWRVAEAVRQIRRSDVPDLPDRVIAATALALGLPLVTRDGKIRSSGIRTIW
jgi:predicted nucleic acid-binding protein